MERSSNPFAKIPQVEKILAHHKLQDIIAKEGKPAAAEIAAEYLEKLREDVRCGGEVPSLDKCADLVAEQCRLYLRKRITAVINATGIILHTNLGRSPLPETVWDAAKEAGSSYSSIEMDLSDGKRGKRFEFLRRCMNLLTDSEDSLIVNNNAAAVFLLLKVLAGNKEVIVCRGQQVQIGGGFRIPEILREAGCRLVEVGTTNITTLNDIKNAITENTAMVLWVHTSNYKIRGFTEIPSIKDIKSILPANIILAADQGSGNLAADIPEEPSVKTLLKNGADLVCFSGDKILGGPQAGWIVGVHRYIEKIASHQLMRTYRVGRAVASLMEETLVYFLNSGLSAAGKALTLNQGCLKNRTESLCAKLKNGSAEVIPHPFSLGGGSTPDKGFDSWALQLNTSNAEAAKAALRDMPVPIIAFILENKVILHLAAVNEKDDAYIAECLNKIL